MMPVDSQQKAKAAFLRETRLDAETQRRLQHKLLSARSETSARIGWPLASGLALTTIAALVSLRLALAPTEQIATLPIDDVSLAFEGEGQISGTERAPVIQWESGTLSVDVTPKRGVDLTVLTPEAVVHVIGTVFTVARAERATHVEVERGTVEVICAGEALVAVHAGEGVTCQPSDLESRVARALALAQSGGAADERLDAIDAALALSGGNKSLVAELLAHRVRALSDAGRRDESLADAERAMSLDVSVRRAELSAYIARTTFLRDGCEAQADIERALAVDPGAPEGLLLATCLWESQPERALALLDACSGRAQGELATLSSRLASLAAQRR